MPDKALRSVDDFTEDDRELCLTVLARYSGNATPASRSLKAAGLDISPFVLRAWKSGRRRPELRARYLEIQQDITPEVRARAAERAVQLSELEGDLEEKLVTHLHDNLETLDDRDKINLLRSNATAKGINLTHADKMQVNPEGRRESQGVDEILAGLKRLGLMVDGTAEDVSDEKVLEAEVVDE